MLIDVAELERNRAEAVGDLRRIADELEAGEIRALLVVQLFGKNAPELWESWSHIETPDDLLEMHGVCTVAMARRNIILAEMSEVDEDDEIEE